MSDFTGEMFFKLTAEFIVGFSSSLEKKKKKNKMLME